MKTVYNVYSEDGGMTFIMEDTYKKDKLISTEVKGFYFGRPDEKTSKLYYGDLKAEY